MAVETVTLPDGTKRFVYSKPVYDNEANTVGEDIQLFETEKKIFSITSGREGKYLGCGIDVTQSFAKWLGFEFSQSELAHRYIKTRSIPGFNEIYTIPSWLSSGLNTLIKHQLPGRYEILEHTAATEKSFLDFVTQQLRHGLPIITLINHGKHWVLIVGIYYDATSIRLRVIDNATTGTLSWERSGILGWGKKFTTRLIQIAGYRSYKEGILISLKAKNSSPS